MRVLVTLLVWVLCTAQISGERAEPETTGVAAVPRPLLDLNSSLPEQIYALPIPPAIASAILDHRTYVAYFTSLYDLLQVEGMTPELLVRLRPLVAVSPVFETARREQEEEDRRAGELHALVQRLLSEEGASEGLVDEYVDHLKEPRDVNRLGYFDLTSYQNVSPIDAVAILRERAQAGRIENLRQLRAAAGLSGWGYRNLRDYLRYADPAPTGRLQLEHQFRMYNTPYTLDDADILNENILGDTSGLPADQTAAFRSYDLNTFAGRLRLEGTDPYLTNKLRLRSGTMWKAGLVSHRNLGETQWDETAKAFASVEGLTRETPLGALRLHRLVVGNYTVALGQGLVMDASDFFQARRAGYGYGVRSIGVRGDLSRSEEFTLRGAAAEASLGRVHGALFYARDLKDAILNPDGSFNAYIRMVPRLSDELLAGIREDIAGGVFAGRGDTSAFLPMRDVMDEQVLGSNLKLELAPGTYVGVTGLEIRTRNRVFDGPAADRWDPRPATLVIDPGRLEDRDSEVAAGYRSTALGNYRRIWGAEAQGVWRNLAAAGEYAKLETSGAPSAMDRIFGGGPEAFLGHAYLQYESFNALVLFRDYDLGYDNPYNRAFSEDTRFEQTLLDGNAFRLKNPYWAQLARGIPQPKAERGWYLSTRYQVSRQLTLTGLEYDAWTRKADGADLQRLAARAEYRPIFPLRLRARHAISTRHASRPDDVRGYTSWDTRLELIANLSRADQVRFLYSTGNVRFAGRGRLSGPASGGDTQDDTTAMRGSPSRALQAVVTHQFGSDIALTVSTEVYDGFLYNYEDNEFVVVDGKGFRNWVLLRSRLSDRLSWRFKWTTDHQLARTYVDVRDFGNLVPPTPDGVNARGDRSSFRLQLDLSL
jgi:DNA uptake protein ComE-like DNA-binding protein